MAVLLVLSLLLNLRDEPEHHNFADRNALYQSSGNQRTGVYAGGGVRNPSVYSDLDQVLGVWTGCQKIKHPLATERQLVSVIHS
jgi:hypothetical protein